MSNEDLRELLAKVHERLGNASPLDTKARDLLRTVMGDIEKALARKDTAVSQARPKLESLAVRFEAEHPAIAETLRQLIDALGKAGI